MNVTLRQLRAFLAVARTGSFTLAAESLYITQSALSGLIKELEQTLGMRLVDRSTRRVYLTEIGARLYPQLDAKLQDLGARKMGDICVLDAMETMTPEDDAVAWLQSWAVEWATLK